jgi:phage terminase small subunit
MAIGNMGGRPPTPTSLKSLRGTIRKHRVNAEEPKGDLSSLRPPPHLDEDAKKQWKAVAKELVKMSVLTTADRTALARYCELQVLYRNTKLQADNDPKIIGILLKLAVELRTLEVLFGLNPSSRTRVHAVSPQTPPGKLSRYINNDKGARRRLLFGDAEECEKEKRFFGDVA